jgi:glucose-6-phosphate-specific signal transduction histidine kinase
VTELPARFRAGTSRRSPVCLCCSVEVEVDALRVAGHDGVGGAGLVGGTGLVGVKDRVEALGGRIQLDSRPGAGTSLQAEFPFTAANDGRGGP